MRNHGKWKTDRLILDITLNGRFKLSLRRLAALGCTTSRLRQYTSSAISISPPLKGVVNFKT